MPLERETILPPKPADNAYFELPMVKKIIREDPNGADKR
jgi:hypothetical protein